MSIRTGHGFIASTSRGSRADNPEDAASSEGQTFIVVVSEPPQTGCPASFDIGIKPIICSQPPKREANWSCSFQTFQHRMMVVSAGDLMKSAAEVAAQLAERGLAVMGSPAQLVSLLRKWVPAREGWLATEAGWVIVPGQRGYHLPDGRVLAGAGKGQVPIISLKAGAGGDHNASGNLAGWRDEVAASARGNPLLMFAISAALAGAMLHSLGLEGGGFNVYGRTSSGKTTVLFAAQSVFGSPDDLMQWHATESAFEAAARGSKDGALIVDEIPTRDPGTAKAIGRTLYMLANGTGKKRSNARLADIGPATWRAMLLTSAEAALPEFHAAARMEMPEGLSVRLADIPAKSWAHGGFATLHGHGSPASFSDAVKAMARRDYGHAGSAFIQHLIAAEDAGKGDTLRKLHDAITRDIVQKVQASGWFRVVSRGRFSIAFRGMSIRTGHGSIVSTGRGSRADNVAGLHSGGTRLLWRFPSRHRQALRHHSASE